MSSEAANHLIKAAALVTMISTEGIKTAQSKTLDQEKKKDLINVVTILKEATRNLEIAAELLE